MSSLELLAQIALMEQQGQEPCAAEGDVSPPAGAALGERRACGAGVVTRRPLHARRSGIGFGLSVLIVFAYYVVMSFSRALGEAGYLPAFIASWFPNMSFLLVGGYFARGRANG